MSQVDVFVVDFVLNVRRLCLGLFAKAMFKCITLSFLLIK